MTNGISAVVKGTVAVLLAGTVTVFGVNAAFNGTLIVTVASASKADIRKAVPDQ